MRFITYNRDHLTPNPLAILSIMSRPIRKLLLPIAALWIGLITAGSISAQVLYVTNYDSGTIGSYDLANNGAALNTSLISGLTNPYGLTIADSTLYVTSNNSRIGQYDLTDLANNSNPTFITAAYPYSVAVSGSNLYAIVNGRIAKYDLTNPANFNGYFIYLVDQPRSLAISGSTLYLADLTMGRVGSYDLSNNGATINADLISAVNADRLAISGSILYLSYTFGGYSRIGRYDLTDLTNNSNPYYIYVPDTGSVGGLAVYGSTLYVSNYGAGTIDAYDISDANTGGSKTTFITGLSGPQNIVVGSAVPEPSTYALLVGVGVLAIAALRRRRAA